jgi:uncharacterized membrane protein
MHRTLRLTMTLALAACYVVGRLVLLSLPNVSFSYLVVFIAGVAFGPRMGASVGFVGRIASDLVVSGLNPVLLPMAFVDLVIGLCSGLLGRAVNVGQRGPIAGLWTRSILVNVGLWLTVAYSVLADTLTWVFYNFLLPQAPNAAKQALWGTLVVSGLVFSVPAIVFNMVLFATAAPPILRNLHEAGLLQEPRPVPAPVAA